MEITNAEDTLIELLIGLKTNLFTIVGIFNAVVLTKLSLQYAVFNFIIVTKIQKSYYNTDLLLKRQQQQNERNKET